MGMKYPALGGVPINMWLCTGIYAYMHFKMCTLNAWTYIWLSGRVLGMSGLVLWVSVYL